MNVTAPLSKMEELAPQIIEPVNRLREKVGGSLHPRYAQSADLAVAALSNTWQAGVLSALATLMSVRRTHQVPLMSAAEAQPMFKQALEMKSLGTNSGYPLVTRVAHSLCRLLMLESNIPLVLVDAHIKTLHAVLRDDVKSDEDKVAQALVFELEQQVASLKKR